MAREINLVPDIKNEMIKALKLRNLIFFICIVIVLSSLGAILIFASIAGGQQAIVDGKNNTVNNLTAKIKSYSDLTDFLTIKDQLGNISEISDNKKVFSRLFGVLSAMIPTNGDRIEISELTLDFSTTPTTITFDAQADALTSPYIDYNVLDAFKKSMPYLRYDYGRYVDKVGAEIPAYCMIESATDGSSLYDQNRGRYAYWLILGEGCNPTYEENLEYDENGEKIYNQEEAIIGYETETYEDQTVVRIWRTPQFADWYSENPVDGAPYMDLDGTIENVAHFESECITYSGETNYQNSSDASETIYKTVGDITWIGTNSSCELVDTSENDGIVISNSSNGRSADDHLVLRFSATITLNPEVFDFNNKHVIAVGPSNRYNVTDSYVQIQSIFGKRANDCAPGDTSCNQNGGN